MKIWKPKFKWVGAFFLNLFLCVFSAWSGVSLKNGNFFIGYTDLVLPGQGFVLKIDRTYNSQSNYDGWFGYGWASQYETYLSAGADRTVTVHEHGGGDSTTFTPKGYNQNDVKRSVAKIVKVAETKSKLTKGQVSELAKRLISDFRLREEYAARLGIKSELKNNSILTSNKRGGEQKVLVSKKYFVREFSDGRKEYFSRDEKTYGRMVGMLDQYGNKVVIDYNRTGKAEKIADNLGRWIRLDWYPNGKVKSVYGSGTKKAEYKYSDRGELLESVDVDGHHYKHGYDRFHNMVKITYQDGTSLDLDYQKENNFVKTLKERNGITTVYSYGKDSANPEGHYWTIVKTQNPTTKKSVVNKYEYWVKKRATGEAYTYKIVTVENGVSTETTYSECCGLPTRIVQGKHVTTFDYNAKGMLTKKVSSDGNAVQLEYDPKVDKPVKIVTNKGWTKFKYDSKGNLLYAVNDKKQEVKLIYNRKGKIQTMLDRDISARQLASKSKTKGAKTRTIDFEYNEIGKPTKISLRGVGTINVSYSNSGGIKNVSSSAGHQIALQVTSAFQNLLSIIAPAGVSLSL